MLDKIRRNKEKKGFTLVELIVVIAIIAILTAVIVPLVSRYTTQATYTSFQSSASALESMMDAGINAYCMKGASPFPGRLIIGRADNTGTPIAANVKVYEADGATETGEADAVTKLKESIEQGLLHKLTPDSGFVVAVENGGVSGVIYNPYGAIDDECKLTIVPSYDEAYEVDGNPCGLLGIYRAATKDGGDSGVTLNAGYAVP